MSAARIGVTSLLIPKRPQPIRPADGKQELRRFFVVGGLGWIALSVISLWLRYGRFRSRGDIALLYRLAGAWAVDSYLVDRGFWVLLALHVVGGFVIGGGVTLLCRYFLLDRVREYAPLTAGASALVALLSQLYFWRAVS